MGRLAGFADAEVEGELRKHNRRRDRLASVLLARSLPFAVANFRRHAAAKKALRGSDPAAVVLTARGESNAPPPEKPAGDVAPPDARATAPAAASRRASAAELEQALGIEEKWEALLEKRLAKQASE